MTKHRRCSPESRRSSGGSHKEVRSRRAENPPNFLSGLLLLECSSGTTKKAGPRARPHTDTSRSFRSIAIHSVHVFTSHCVFWKVYVFVCFLFVCISLTVDGPQRARLPIPPIATLLSCLWSRRILPSPPGSHLMNLYRDASSAYSSIYIYTTAGFVAGQLMGDKQQTTILYLQPLIPPKRFDIPPPLTGGCSEGLGAFRFFFKQQLCQGRDYSHNPLESCSALYDSSGSCYVQEHTPPSFNIRR